MRKVFADTFFWTALADSRDQWHDVVRQYDASLENVALVTTDEVLVEFATQLGVRDRMLREIACDWVRAILADPAIEVVAVEDAAAPGPAEASAALRDAFAGGL